MLAKPLAVLASFFAASAFAQAPDVSLTRFECGKPRMNDVNERFSDTFAYPGLKIQFTFSCYLIKHGSDYMIWDTGFGPGGDNSPAKTLPEQLQALNVTPDNIKYVGISHYHGDHIGGAQFFPKATLLIGKGDWDQIKSNAYPENVNPLPLKAWASGGSKVEAVALDKDIFGDGTVLMLYTPGHTPGHHSLLVRLKQMGPVILTGDAAHFHENYDSDGVPGFNSDRAQTIASLERIKKLVGTQKATVVIQHDARDVSKLPVAPESAK